MQSPTPSVPPTLSRYPADIQSAYKRFVEAGKPEDMRVLVHAALKEFMPKPPGPIGPAVLGEEQRLVDDLGLDSLAVAELIFFFEDTFAVSIPSHEILEVKTVGDLERYIQRKLAEAKATVRVAS